MKCQFCRVRHATQGSRICTYCDLTYSQEVKDLLYGITQTASK